MWKQLFLVVLLSFILYRAFELVLFFGVFNHTFNHAPGPCRSLPGIDFGSEDIQVLPDGLAFISSGMRFNGMGNKDAVGKIYLFDFNKPDVAAKELKIESPKKQSLNPHGISTWTDNSNNETKIYLYVINHLKDGEAVEKFRFDPSKLSLTHVKQIKDETFRLTNNLVVVDEDKFYITNYAHVNPGLELAFMLHWGSIAYFDGHSSRIVGEGLFMPNGIASSGRSIYVVVHGQLRIYERLEDDSLASVKSVQLWNLLDNINVDTETGDVWIAAHPRRYNLFKYFLNPSDVKSPSQILKVKLSGEQSEVTEVYSNDGSEISASSVAVRYKKNLLIGSIFTNTLLCEMKI